MIITDRDVNEALLMLRERYRLSFGHDMRASGLGGLTPAAAVTQLLAAPHVQEFLAESLTAVVSARRSQ